MRGLLLLTAILAAGCASQPTNQHTASSSGSVAPTEAGRLALAKNLNLKLINKDGQQLYCRSDYATGSHIKGDMTCIRPGNSIGCRPRRNATGIKLLSGILPPGPAKTPSRRNDL